MESSRSEDFFGVLVEKIGLTIWCPDFCDGHRTELCSIAETLSYTNEKNKSDFVLYLNLNYTNKCILSEKN